MIIMQDDGKHFAVYCRTNRRVQWRYAEYGGRYESPEKAVEAVAAHYQGQRCEYQIENMDDGSIITGFVN